MYLIDGKNRKILHSESINYFFNKDTGYMAVWGKTQEEDPEFSPYGPFIMDIEISTICHAGCKFCYKSNTADGKNMDLETFKKLFSKFPKVLTQIAFGIGSVDTNPDMIAIMQHCRENGIIPNVTVNGFRMSDEIIDQLASVVGAVAISNYGKNSCYETVKKFTDRGLKQVNIHQLVSEETKSQIYELINDIKTDDRLSKLNAVVFLSLKQRGRGEGMTPISQEEFKKIVDLCFENDIPMGFDSCGAQKFMKSIDGRPDYDKLYQLIEPCESGIFSYYINSEGKSFPCSFTENGDGIDVLNCNDFIEDVWMNPLTVAWRKKLLDNNRFCPAYNI